MQDCNGMTALHYAIMSGCTSLVELLLKNTANVEAKNNENLNAMDLAARTSNTELIR